MILIEYRLVITKKPTLRLWKREDGKSVKMAEIEDEKAAQIKQAILPQIKLTPYMSWRDGRTLYHLDEEYALRLFLAMKLVTGVRDQRRIDKLITAAQKMDRGDSLNWYSFYLKLGFKSILAMRTAYL
jgi:hypothetical protein